MKRITVLAATLVLAACSRPETGPQASIQDIMVGIMDPAADALWDAVSTEVAKEGVEEKQPHTDEEWLAARGHAVALANAGRLLAAGSRPVTHGGKQVEDAHVEGVLRASEVERSISEGGNGFRLRAVELQEAAGRALAAIDRRNPAQLLAAGAAIDQACERCHQAYWYPNAKEPAAKWPAPLTAASLP